jgi:hypothetical protein
MGWPVLAGARAGVAAGWLELQLARLMFVTKNTTILQSDEPFVSDALKGEFVLKLKGVATALVDTEVCTNMHTQRVAHVHGPHRQALAAAQMHSKSRPWQKCLRCDAKCAVSNLQNQQGVGA